MTGSDAVPSLKIAFPEEWDLSPWDSRRGSMPDESPYGLHLLGAAIGGVESEFVRLPRPTLTALLRTLVPGTKAPKDPAGGLMLTWDEFTALRIIFQADTIYRASGLIWATDPARGLLARMKKAAIRRGLNRLDLIWCLSEPQVQAASDWLGPHSPRVVFLKFGIDTEFYSPSGEPAEALILSAGGDKDRDHATLFEALAHVVEKRPDLSILVQAQTEETVPCGVTVVPRLSHAELRALYQRASMTVVLTRTNLHASGMTVALEAQAVGRPVVVTDTPGMSDYVRHGETGFLVPPGDASAAASRILLLADDASLTRRMGNAAHKYVRDNHSSQRMMSSLGRILKDDITG